MATSRNSRFPQTRHSREDVAAAALKILDDYGLADLTMRRLAATLDVQPSALYWHFSNKQTLLAHLADLIVDRPEAEPADNPARPGPWRAAASAEAEALRASLLAYRDGAEVVSSTLALGLGADAPARRLTRIFEDGGVDPETASAAAAVLIHFALGYVSHEQQRIQADSIGAVAPESAAAPAAITHPRGADGFGFGVNLILDGLSEHAGRPEGSRAAEAR
ncbi:TetR family transcriptional regulator [Mycetocola spongiae]|uniref:TetR family transcriptional regulator n=1 Tax=Mycetocola spongiae TaxID=2859226 RepID=UPI001CF17A59|nr:TetR/AcrR family transcriptional regulator C-terminal domain-containing protein [Mycetocola spongiae]UCR88843.1 TetR/AcrR family transcriptional regulator C-terminal domain-containing protein [Mycetocola spongiae]